MPSSDPTQYKPGSYDHEFDEHVDDSIFDAEFPLASPWKRLVAVIIDTLLVFGAAIPGLVLLITGEETNSEPLIALGILLLVGAVAAVVIYQIVILSRDGQSIGKRILNLRIVDANDGSNPGFVRVILLRGVVMQALGMIPFVSLVDALMVFTENHQTIHDRLATTVVEDETPGAF